MSPTKPFTCKETNIGSLWGRKSKECVQCSSIRHGTFLPRIDLPTNTTDPSEIIDVIKEDSEMDASTDTILQLSQDLAFLRKYFQESSKIANNKRDGENNTFLVKIASLQESTDALIGTIATFVKNTLTLQDDVIISLKQGQELANNRMTTVSTQFRKQMENMNQSMVKLH